MSRMECKIIEQAKDIIRELPTREAHTRYHGDNGNMGK